MDHPMGSNTSSDDYTDGHLGVISGDYIWSPSYRPQTMERQSSMPIEAPDSSKPFRFLDLPSELRIQVYKQLEPDLMRWGMRIHVSRTERLSKYRIDSILLNQRNRDLLPHRRNLPPTLKDVEAAATDWTSLSKQKLSWLDGRTGRETWMYYSTITQDDVFTGLQALIDLAYTCRTTRDEILQKLVRYIQASDVGIAGWYGVTRPFLSATITELKILKPLLVAENYRQRWFAQIISQFPALEALFIKVHTHKDSEIWGTEYALDDLRMMKYILNESQVEVAVNSGGTCEASGMKDGQCRPWVGLFTEKHFEQQAQNDAEWFDSFIDIEGELKRALTLKRKRAQMP
ncbi:uncharacterized protein AB675_934 [Cyphellophora attinorum]|uniref:F-box domain-containing protein n=1 Tax=Cyphellophora attinorum TaxID=1664694 RepID=A0A0N1HAX3_9EURO|nr:uncharacterized protein AB675_934 [Phialophora attinorum]KPI45397.1 hypothetical protein AB675_934 [Phialophora attinorum]